MKDNRHNTLIDIAGIAGQPLEDLERHKCLATAGTPKVTRAQGVDLKGHEQVLRGPQKCLATAGTPKMTRAQGVRHNASEYLLQRGADRRD